MKMKIEVTVQIEVPMNVYIDDVKEYVRDAVKTHCGGLHPEDPMFNLNRDSVKIIAVTERET